MGRKFARFSKIFFNISVIIGGIGILFYSVTENGEIQNYVGSFLKDTGEQISHATGKEPVRYKTWYSSVRDNFNGSGDVAKAAQAEGTVLLKNENNALPLNSTNDKVSFFGVSSYQTIYSLDGAGEVKINFDTNDEQYFTDEMREEGFDVNQDLENWYNGDGKRYWREDLIYGGGGNGENADLNGASWEVIPQAAKEKEGYNTAIFVTGRITNEAIDIMPGNVSGMGAKDDNYLILTEKEESVLQGLEDMKTAGKLDKIIVLFNTAAQYMQDIPTVLADYSVDAAMWIGFPGSHGIDAVCDILAGVTAPSGRLSDFWYNSRDAVPSTKSFGNGSNVVIQEDIFTGYKYAESRYADYVLGSAGAGTYDYDGNVSYPFGYGQSYTTFNYSDISIRQDEDPDKNYYERYVKDEDLVKKEKILRDQEDRRKAGDDYILSVNVTNTGSVAAKETVQVYLNKPYTDQNKKDGVNKSFIELVGFGKTKKLAPQESETIEIKIDANKYFASYNDKANDGEGAYVVDQGTYRLAVATNSHQATNSILSSLAASGTTVSSERQDELFGEGNANHVLSLDVGTDYTNSYVYWTKGGTTPKNIFDHADPNKASGDANKVTFMSRNNWEGTTTQDYRGGISLTGNMGLGNEVNSGFTDDLARKHYAEAIARLGEDSITKAASRPSGSLTEIQLYDMIGVEFDPNRGATEEEIQLWSDFMDQLTWSELADLTGHGRRLTYGLSSIGKPQTNDVNASNGISWKYDMSLNDNGANGNIGLSSRFASEAERNFYPVGYPCEGIIGATFNVDLAYAVGQSMGEDALWSGASGLYGFGLGLHRNPYHGRSGEYYSDDPFLTGVIAGYESAGAQSKGLYVYNKHFVLNDQETGRSSYNTWLREQAMRETYLRTFEIAIEIGDAMCVMTSFNSIGTYWSGCDYSLMTVALRDEMGMAGFAVTDWYKSSKMNMTYSAIAGQDLPDGTDDGAIEALGGIGYYEQAIRRNAQRLLYTVANSNAMNFIGEGVWIETIPPKWLNYRNYILLGGTGLMALSIAFLVFSYVSEYFADKKDPKAIPGTIDNTK